MFSKYDSNRKCLTKTRRQCQIFIANIFLHLSKGDELLCVFHYQPSNYLLTNIYFFNSYITKFEDLVWNCDFELFITIFLQFYLITFLFFYFGCNFWCHFINFSCFMHKISTVSIYDMYIRGGAKKNFFIGLAWR